MKLAASLVIVGFVEVDGPTATSPKSSNNGWAIPALGDTTGVGMVDGTSRSGSACIDVRRESMLRMTDLRLAGWGSAERSRKC
jgi:hypothetical protein